MYGKQIQHIKKKKNPHYGRFEICSLHQKNSILILNCHSGSFSLYCNSEKISSFAKDIVVLLMNWYLSLNTGLHEEVDCMSAQRGNKSHTYAPTQHPWRGGEWVEPWFYPQQADKHDWAGRVGGLVICCWQALNYWALSAAEKRTLFLKRRTENYIYEDWCQTEIWGFSVRD